MIQGRSNLVYRANGTNKYVSAGLVDEYDTTPIHIDISLVDNDVLDIEKLRGWKEGFKNAEFILEGGKYICGWQIEKMSKRWYNVVNPDDICRDFGADTFRMYEMFLGPLEDSKPFITQGIDGVFRFLKRAYNLFVGNNEELILTDDEPTNEELKLLHQTIKKAQEDVANLSFNTTVPQFMVFTNEMTKLKSHKRAILEPFLVVLSPYAPHFAEELWERIGNTGSITNAKWPELNEDYLQEKSYEYPVQINGKVRAKVKVGLDLDKNAVEEIVLSDENVKRLLEDKQLRKVIVVPGRIVNLVAN